MNIVVITNSYPNKSKPYAGKHVERHVQIHRDAGATVQVYHPGESRTGLFFTTWKYLKLWLAVLWVIFSKPIDLVHAHWVLPAGLFGMFLALVRRKPFIITSHGAFTNIFEKHNPVVRMLVRLVLDRADKIIAVGMDQKEIIEAITKSRNGKVICINMGVLIPDTIPDQENARKELNLADDEQIVLFIGNLLKRKGPDLLVEAARLIKSADFQIYIGGQGPEKETLRKQIESYNLEKKITLIETVEPEKVLVWMAAADVCVVPSRNEPFGLVAIESLAAGTPVIAAEVGGLIETVKPGYNGLLFPVDSANALADSLQKLLSDPALRESMSAAAPGTIAAHDMKIQAGKVLEVYKTLLFENY